MSDRAYGLVRSLVERLGGEMYYEREGHRYGAWVIRIGEHSVTIESSGNRSFPELDRLYVPRVPNPQHWDDYEDQLVPDAEARLLCMLGIWPERLPEEEIEELACLIERAKWKFAWTYARTYPHEYTTKALCAPEDHARLIEYIERYGVVERFGKDRRKYFYFQGRKYWHMGDPYSENPDDWPNVINRTWVDVRRHAENVRHVWTPEEVELQKRLWEIQLEKSTDRPKRREDAVLDEIARQTGLEVTKRVPVCTTLRGDFQGFDTEVQVVNDHEAGTGSRLTPLTGEAAWSTWDIHNVTRIRMKHDLPVNETMTSSGGCVVTPSHIVSVLGGVPRNADEILKEMQRLVREIKRLEQSLSGQTAAEEIPNQG